MTEVRVSGNTNYVTVDLLKLLDAVAESNDLRRTHKRAGNTNNTTHIIDHRFVKKHIIKHLIVEFLVINQIKFDDDNTSQKNQRVLQLTLSKEPRVSYLIYQHNVSHSI